MIRLLSLLVLFSVVSTSGFAQSEKKEGKTARIWVQNTGATTIAVVCMRNQISLADSSVNYFCWDLCYSPATDTSVGTRSIAPGGTDNAFYVGYDPSGGMGTSIIEYCFYVNGIPGDSACYTMSLSESSPIDSVYGTIAINSLVGIEFIASSNHNEILDIYPNPAKDLTILNYSLAQNYGDAQLVVRNLLGSQVYKTDLVGSAGQVVIHTESLHNGLYFCTMVVDNKVYETKRLVVNH